MSPTFIGLISIILGLLSLFSSVTVDVFGLPRIFLFTETIPLILSVVVIYLGILARRSSKIVGLIGIVIGVIGALSHLLRLIGFGQ